MMQLNVLYFARLREIFKTTQEIVTVPETTASVADLLQILRARGEPWSSELAPERRFRVAVGQQIAPMDTPLTDHAEVAIFPPVTGG